MTTSAISLSTTLPQSTSAIAPSNSFFNRCIEDLSSEKVSASAWHSKLWMVASGAAFVAFTVLAVAAFTIAGLYAPLYAPFIAIGALIGAVPVVNVVEKFLKNANSCEAEANKYLSIQHYNEELNAKDPVATQVELIKRGVNLLEIPGKDINRPEDYASLRPILAQAEYLDSKIQEDLNIKEALAKDANALIQANYAENQQKIYELRTTALFTEGRAMQTKIEAAFVNAVLRRGDFNGTMHDVASVTPVTYFDRILGNALDDGTVVNEFVTFKNNTVAPITYHEVKTMTVAQLGQRFAAAMT